MSTEMRDLREELRELMLRDTILPNAAAREIRAGLGELMDYLNGSRKSAAFERRVAQFIEARNRVWDTLEALDNAGRRQVALQLIRAIGGDLKDAEIAPPDRLLSILDHARMWLHDLYRLNELMESAASPQQLAEAIRSALQPGDRMLISRAGCSEGSHNAKVNDG